MPTARFALAVVAAMGKVYAIGGSGNGGTLAVVEAYDPAADTWAALTSMPTPRQHFAAALGPDGLIYTFGGTGAQPLYNTVEAYDPATDTWVAKRPMPTARVSLGAAFGPNGRAYAIGGNDGGLSGEPFGTSRAVEEYDPVTDTWSVRTSMPTARQLLAVVNAANGRIYAVGGELSPFQNLATVEAATIA
jgi:N-acetylneuraminic acid mutarotase